MTLATGLLLLLQGFLVGFGVVVVVVDVVVDFVVVVVASVVIALFRLGLQQTFSIICFILVD